MCFVKISILNFWLYLGNEFLTPIDMYDIIGDVHGYAEPLKRLLLKMGYEKRGMLTGIQNARPAHSLPETAIDLNTCTISGYGQSEKSVFFGHYWFQGLPQLLKPNVCCVDFSVANKGVLVAYRHDGENILDPGKFVFEHA